MFYSQNLSKISSPYKKYVYECIYSSFSYPDPDGIIAILRLLVKLLILFYEFLYDISFYEMSSFLFSDEKLYF
jgi:hypothetical protein